MIIAPGAFAAACCFNLSAKEIVLPHPARDHGRKNQAQIHVCRAIPHSPPGATALGASVLFASASPGSTLQREFIRRGTRPGEQSSSPSLLGDLSSRLQSSATDCSSTASTATCDRVSPRRFCTLPRWGRWGRHRPSWIRRLGAFFNALFGLRGCCGLWIVTSVFEQLVRHIMCGLRFISASAALVTRSSNPHDTMNCICIK